MSIQQIINDIKLNGITGTDIQNVINIYDPVLLERERLYNAYMGVVPILDKKHEDKDKVNNQLTFDYRGYITQQAQSYFVGNPIVYDIDNRKYSKAEYEKLTENFDTLKYENNYADLDNTTAKDMIICGVAARLVFQYGDGDIRLKRVAPWQVIFLNDPVIDRTKYAFIISNYETLRNNKKVTLKKVELFDDTNIHYFKETYVGGRNGKTIFILDDDKEKAIIPHLFKKVPVIKFVNNDEEKGDFVKAESLMNAVDQTMSDVQDEIDEYRMAYLGVFGDGITNEDDLKKNRRNGTIVIPKGSDVKFITKALQSEAVNAHLKLLDTKIFNFCSAVNISDEKFSSGGAESGESRKYKLIPLENKTKIKERKFNTSLSHQFECIYSHVTLDELGYNSRYMSYRYTPSLPIDLLYFAEVTARFKGMISEKERLSMLPFVEDVDKEIAEMEKDMENGFINIDDINVNNNE